MKPEEIGYITKGPGVLSINIDPDLKGLPIGSYKVFVKNISEKDKITVGEQEMVNGNPNNVQDFYSQDLDKRLDQAIEDLNYAIKLSDTEFEKRKCTIASLKIKELNKKLNSIIDMIFGSGRILDRIRSLEDKINNKEN